MIKPLLPAAALLIAAPALAQEVPAAFTLSGSATLISDYRFRGLSQSDNRPAVQGGLNLDHVSGLYASAWASSVAGWGRRGGGDAQVELAGGYRTNIGTSGFTLDGGLTWRFYPGAGADTSYAEPYARLGTTLGPVGLIAGIAYAPAQKALGNWSATATSRPGDKHDNLYLWGDATIAVPRTPVTARAHLGHSDGSAGLGPGGGSLAPTGSYWDWQLGIDYRLNPLTFGLAYVDTGIGRARSAYLRPAFATRSGRSIAGRRLIASVSASF